MNSAAEGVKSKCIVCEFEIGADIEKCPKCGALQGWKPCVLCYEKIARHATKCKECGSSQRRWRWVKVPETTLALLASLFAVASTAITPIANLMNRRSNTFISFTSTDPNYLYADVFNSGRSPSSVRKAWLRFGQVPLADTRLNFAMTEKREPRRIVPPQGEVHLALTLPGLQEKSNALCTSGIVTLEMEVEESNGLRLRTSTFDVDEMRPLITNALGRFVECPDSP